MKHFNAEELFENLPDTPRSLEDEYNSAMSDLKEKINNLCYAAVPKTMTIEEFENLTVEIIKLIDNEWQNKLKAGAN